MFREPYLVNKFIIAREDVPVLQAMIEFISTVEENEDHLFHKVLTDVPLNVEKIPALEPV